MAKESAKNPQASAIEEHTKGWAEVERSVPLYNFDECGYVPVCGYPVDVAIYGKAPDVFKVIIFLLTLPSRAKDNDRIVDIPAGKEIAVRGADLRDLEQVALHPTIVREYFLTPNLDEKGQPIKLKMKDPKKAPMPTWKRRLNPKQFNRADVCPNRVAILPPSEVNKLLLAQKNGEDGDTSFDTSEMRG